MKVRNQIILFYVLLTVVPILIISSIILLINTEKIRNQVSEQLHNQVKNLDIYIEEMSRKHRNYAFFVGHNKFDLNENIEHLNNFELSDIGIMEIFIEDENIYQYAENEKDEIYYTSQSNAEAIWKDLNKPMYTDQYKETYVSIASNTPVLRHCSIISDPEDKTKKIGFLAIITPLNYDFLSELPFLENDYYHYYIKAGDEYRFSDKSFQNDEIKTLLHTQQIPDYPDYKVINLSDMGKYFACEEVIFDRMAKISNKMVHIDLAYAGILYDYSFISSNFLFARKLVLVLSLTIILIIVVISLIFSQRFSKPLYELRNSIIKFDENKAPIKITDNLPDEIYDLASSLKKMTFSIVENDKELKREKDTLELMHQKIMNSIQSATHIQQALLPSEQIFQVLFKDYFIIWKPIELISGDLYFIERCNDKFLIGLADCSGQDFSSTLMTTIISAGIHEIIQTNCNSNLPEILSALNRFIHDHLNNIHETTLDYRVDIGLCYVDPVNNKLIYAGSNIHLLYYSPNTNELNRITGNNKSIGNISPESENTFETHTVSIDPDMKFYMSTDGLTNQIGGESQLSFGVKRLRKMLFGIRNMPLNEQKRIIEETLQEYQGLEDQNDDITMIAFTL